MTLRNPVGTLVLALGLAALSSSVSADPVETMTKPVPGQRWDTKAAFTVGETIGGYQPPGILDGLGAYRLGNWRHSPVRVLANHELGTADGYGFTIRGPGNVPVPVAAGSRISYFDIDQRSLKVSRAGLAMTRIYNRRQEIVATMANFEGTGRSTLARFCSSSLYEPNEFGRGRGTSDRVYITGEEDGGSFSEFGGGQWALNPTTADLWAVPAMGRGGWENVTQLDTGRPNFVAFILSDDTAPFTTATGGPFDTDADGQMDGAPLYLYIGRKQSGDFLDRNGLKNGWLYVWVADDAAKKSVADFNGTGNSLSGHFEPVVNSGPQLDTVCAPAARFGQIKDGFGYASQRCLWYQARVNNNAFQFSRPEDVSTNPRDGSEFVLASTGREGEFGNADVWGNIYTMDVKFRFGFHGPIEARGVLKIVYDANDVTGNNRIGYPSRDFGLRNADNLDWADDGSIYVNEDSATVTTVFGGTSGEEASIWKLDPRRKKLTRIAQIDRSAVLDASTQLEPFDRLATTIGAWETSGILDVSDLFSRAPGSLFVFDVQAHGIERQTEPNTSPVGPRGPNPDSDIFNANLREGGQLLFLEAKRGRRDDDHDHDDD